MNSRKISRKTLIKIFDKACQKSFKQNQKELQSIEMNNSRINIMQEKKNLWKQIKIDFPDQKEIKWQNKFKDMKTKYQDLQDQVNYENDFNDEAYQEIPRDFLDDDDDQQNTIDLKSIMDNLTDDLLRAFQTSPVVDVLLLSQNQNNKFTKQVYRVSGISKINQFVNTLLGNDELISPSESEYRNRFMNCKSIKYSLQVRDPGTNKMIQRSFSGQGNDLQQCNVFENENIYIPLSGNCLQNILIKNYPDRKDEIIETLSQYCEEKQIYRQNIRYCDLSKISDLLKIKITNLYNKNLKDKIKYQPKYVQYDILVFIYERHYVQIKSNQYKQALQDIKDNLVWTQKTLKDAQLGDIKDLKISPKMNDRKLKPLIEQYHGVYVFDLEAYTGDNDDWFQPYACGYFSLEMYNILYPRIQQKKEEVFRNFAIIKDGNDCILKMLIGIDQQNKVEKVFKVGEKLCNKKKEIILVAHNSAKFDTYLILQLKNIKFEKVVEKNGIICLTINDPQFKNCNFKIIDSYRFIAVSLSKLCTSFQVPQSFCKTELNHQQITKDNWQSLKNEWVPYLQNDVLSLAHIWHSFTKKLYEATKNSDNKSLDLRKFITIPSFAKAVLNQMTTDGDQIYSNDDPVVRQFFRKNIRGGRVQCLISHFENETIKNIDLDKQYMKLLQKKKEYVLDSKIVDQIKQNKNYLIPFDATSLYPSAMALDKYYPNILSARLYNIQNDNITFLYACKKQFVIQCNLNIPQDLKFVPISYKSKDGMAHFRTGYIQNQVINDVDYCELKRFGISIDCISQGIVFEQSILAPYKQFVLQMFQQRNIVKNNDPVLGDMFKLLMNSSYGKLCQKDHVDEFCISSEKEFYDEHYDSQIIDYNVLQNGQIQFKKEFYGDSQKAELHMACYVLSYSKQIMNDFVLQIGAHQQTKIYYMDTDSMYIHYNDYQKYLSNVQDGLGGGKNDYGENEAIIKAHFIGSKQKVCYSIALKDYKKVKMGQISKHITFKGIQTDQFNTLSEPVIQCILKQEKLFLEHYIWKKDKTKGIQLCNKEHRQNKLHLKSISNQAQLSKYNYNQETGIYQYKHCDRNKPWCYYFENQDKQIIE